jgi:hypothetical protein
MKKVLLAVFFLPFLTSAQDLHFSVRLGAAGYSGDLKEKMLSLSQMNFLGSLGARYDLTERVALRTYFTYAKLQGDDKKGTADMQRRNLNFKTNLFEWELGAQYSILNPNESWWVPYVYAGLGVFHYNPFTYDENGVKTFLQPLGTEGKSYGLTQLCIPLGLGIERSLNEDMRLGVEIGYRKLFTDYLDDVSGFYVDQATLLSTRGQKAVDLAFRGDEVGAGTYPSGGSVRGKPNKDGYYYIAFTFTVRAVFDKYKQIAGLPSSRRSRRVGCPANMF